MGAHTSTENQGSHFHESLRSAGHSEFTTPHYNTQAQVASLQPKQYLELPTGPDQATAQPMIASDEETNQPQKSRPKHFKGQDLEAYYMEKQL